jgi:tRNA(His) 5'-end guanylyltransferase
MKDDLGNRMKGYERVPNIRLTPRMPFIIRVDGKAFHSFTKGFDKPWDLKLVEAMTTAAQHLMKEVMGSKIAYIQSDEISILCTDYDRLESQPWFDKKVQKICSVSASIATMAFNSDLLKSKGKIHHACFDARVFPIPKEEVCNYFIWRQQDAVRNSIQGLGQNKFSHKQLQGKNGSQIQEMLFQEHGINWNALETWKKRGWCVVREKTETERTLIKPDWDSPTFSQDRDYIEKHLYVLNDKRLDIQPESG